MVFKSSAREHRFCASLSVLVMRVKIYLREGATYNRHFICLFTVEIYLSPVETHCSNIDYFPANIEDKVSGDDAMTRLHLARSVIALFILR